MKKVGRDGPGEQVDELGVVPECALSVALVVGRAAKAATAGRAGHIARTIDATHRAQAAIPKRRSQRESVLVEADLQRGTPALRTHTQTRQR